MDSWILEDRLDVQLDPCAQGRGRRMSLVLLVLLVLQMPAIFIMLAADVTHYSFCILKAAAAAAAAEIIIGVDVIGKLLLLAIDRRDEAAAAGIVEKALQCQQLAARPPAALEVRLE